MFIRLTFMIGRCLNNESLDVCRILVIPVTSRWAALLLNWSKQEPKSQQSQMSEIYFMLLYSEKPKSSFCLFLFFSESPFSLKVDSKSSVQPNRGDANSSQSSSGKSGCEMLGISGISDTPQIRLCRNAEMLEDSSGVHGVC